MPAPVSPVLGKPSGGSRLDVFDLSRRPGALIAGTWAAMQYMGERYVVL